MNPRDPNIQLVEGVVAHLGPLKNEFVFVGGCATGLLITDTARPPVRATTDVDLVTELASREEYYKLSERLRENGFEEDSQSDVICRWRIGGYQVDIMPSNREILGFNNRWHQEAINTARPFVLPSGEEIRLVTPVSFIATKLEAFNDRGEGDFGVSHDVEDIITLVDGRESIVTEVNENRAEVGDYVREEFERLLAEQDFTESINWHLRGDRESQGRAISIIKRMREIVGI